MIPVSHWPFLGLTFTLIPFLLNVCFSAQLLSSLIITSYTSTPLSSVNSVVVLSKHSLWIISINASQSSHQMGTIIITPIIQMKKLKLRMSSKSPAPKGSSWESKLLHATQPKKKKKERENFLNWNANTMFNLIFFFFKEWPGYRGRPLNLASSLSKDVWLRDGWGGWCIQHQF